MNKIKKSLKETEDFVRIYKNVLATFAQIQQASALNKSYIMELTKIHHENAFFFDKALEQAFLKIFFCFHEKANKKIPNRFQTVAEMLFKQLLKQASEEVITSFNQFCDLLSQAIYSTIMNVRIMASRILFQILKNLPNTNSIDIILKEKTLHTVGQAVYFLIKQKVSTYRQLGIKLSSLVLHGKLPSQESIENEMFKIMSTDENEIIRKMVMTNIPLRLENIERILVRLRDKNSEIRAILLRRLQAENYRFESLKLNNLYKLLYDGYGTKDIICKEEALRYFASYFKENQMDVENKFETFVEMFQPNLLLVNSHLYILFNKLIGELLVFLPQKTMCEYIMKLCNKVKSACKQKSIQISSELIWLKRASNIGEQSREISNAFQQYSPSGLQLSQLLRQNVIRKDIFLINEILQIFINIKVPDEIGRNRMYNVLNETLKTLTFFQFKLNLNQIPKDDDICSVQNKEQIHMKKFMLSYYDTPIISNSMDLIYPIINTMKHLRSDSFLNSIQETISDFQNLDEYSIYNEKTKLQMTLKSLLNNQGQRNDKNKTTISMIQDKIQKINQEIDLLKYKTVVAVTAVSKIQYDWNLQPYLLLLKEQMSRADQSNGLYLLGLYCLGDVEKVNNFFSIFWQNIMGEQPSFNSSSEQKSYYRLRLMISLKVMTDFIIKFNILKSERVMNNTSTDETTVYNSDTFMDRMTHLILDKDPHIKIFAIECLCKMIYHNRVDQSNISTYFLYLLLLWWETSSEVVSAKSVHTISLFFRSYLEKGNEQVKKLAEMLCIFHKILKIFQEKNKTINKKLIIYNLKMNQFMKKTVSIATTVLKYHKQKKTIWNYEEPELGPQQFFLLYLLYEPGFQNILQKPVNISDFYIKCPLQTLLFVKKKVSEFISLIQQEKFYPKIYHYDKIVTKKSMQQINRFKKEVETHIEVKHQQKYNEDIIKSLEVIFNQSCKYVNEEAKRIAKNIEDEEIFINIDSDDDQFDNASINLDIDQDLEQSFKDPSQDEDLKSISEQFISEPSEELQIKKVSREPKKKVLRNPKNKKVIIEVSDQESEESIKSVSNSSSEDDQQVQSIRRNRKKAPRDYSLSATDNNLKKEDLNSNSTGKQIKRITRSRKPIL